MPTDPPLTLDETPPAAASVNPPAPAPETTPDAADKLVPVTEAIRYRKRAQTAEQQLGQVQRHVAELRQQLDASRETITALERRSKIDAMLTASDAIDLEAARLLTEISVSQMDEPDVAAAVDDLRRHKPYLFRHRPPRQDRAMSPRVDPRMDPRSQAPPTLDDAAELAASTGDRRDLLAYLRLRRR